MTKIILSLNDKCLVQYSGDDTLSFVVFFSFLLPNVVLGVVTLGTKLEPVLGVEVALGVGVVPGALLVVGGLAGGLLPVDVVPSALLLVDGVVGTLLLVDGVVGAVPGALLLVETVAPVVVLGVRGAEEPVLEECDVDVVDGSRTAHPRPSNGGRRVEELG